ARGVASGRWRFVYNAIDPFVSALYSVPSVALGPLIAVAFRSVGDAPRIATVALFAVFPILINTQQGVRNVGRQLLEVARSFNTSERKLWTDVIVPSAIPYVLAGVRLGIGRGLIGMIVAEFFIGLVGLGFLIISYENVFRIDRMFVPVIVLAALGILLMGFVQWLEGRVTPRLSIRRDRSRRHIERTGAGRHRERRRREDRLQLRAERGCLVRRWSEHQKPRGPQGQEDGRPGARWLRGRHDTARAEEG